MSDKVTLTPIANINYGTSAANDINNNNAAITAALDNTLSRDGTTPNQMNSALDMNGNQILNLPAPTLPNSPLRMQDLANFKSGGTVTVSPTLPTPTLTTLGGVLQNNAVAHNWVNSISSTGAPTLTRPQFSDISGQLSLAQLPTGSGQTSYPQSMDACIRLSSNTISTQYAVSCYGGGNGLWLYSPIRSLFEMTAVSGAGTTIDVNNCSIDGVAGQSLANSTLYYVYAYAPSLAGGFVQIDHSTTPFASGDPFGASTVTGWLYKNVGNLNYRFIGFVQKDANGNVWNAGVQGVYFSGIASYYQRQRLNYQILYNSFGSHTSWTELDSTQYISALVIGDGAEPSGAFSGTLSNDTGSTTSYVGVSINGVTPYDYVKVSSAANNFYPFSVNLTLGDFSNQFVTLRVMAKSTSGSVTISNATLTMNLNQ